MGEQAPSGSASASRHLVMPPASHSPGASVPLITRIVENARRAPNAPAIRFGALDLNYRQLLEAADKLAATLSREAVGVEVPVGICLPRSINHPAAIVAIMRAGGAFIPMDPGWPLERQKYVLEHAKARAVITSAELAPTLASEQCAAIVEATQPCTPTSHAAIPTNVDDHLAYIVYTSGSTGRPKGVEILHRNLANLIDWHIASFGLTAKDQVSALAGLGFDATIWEIVPALVAGACIHLVEESARASASDLRKWLLDRQITVAFVPTPVAESLIRMEWPSSTALRTLLTGGDTLHVWPRPDLPFDVVNNYGPSECAVVATSGPVAANLAGALSLPTIGKPIQKTDVLILDESKQPAGEGEIGEIYIAGANVGRGYRPPAGDAAANFLSLEGVPGAVYRTGDFGRWNKEGEIEFHGRTDSQLKVRGHRIEAAEVTAALDRYPLIQQSAVAAWGEGSSRKLVAYVVSSDRQLLRAAELKEFLGDLLPRYMLPDTYVRLPALPMSANGKVDRAELPAPDATNMLSSAVYRAPNSSAERAVAGLIEEVLDIRKVGADDNFFLLGGHSLLGAQLVQRLMETMSVEISLRDLFQAQTVAKLAAKVEQELTRMIAGLSDEEVRQRLVK